MKLQYLNKIIINMMIIFILFSCVDVFDNLTPTYDMPINITLKTCLNNAGLIKKKLICIEIFINWWVVETSDPSDEWQEPNETYKKRKGDCEDKAILFLWIAYQELNIKGKLRTYHSFKCNHATAKYSIYNYEYDYSSKCDIYHFEFTFDEALKIAKYKW